MCRFPENTPIHSYTKGCRCSRCLTFVREYKKLHKRKQRANPEHMTREKEHARKWKENILNAAALTASGAARRAICRRITKILTPEEKDRIYKIYREAKELSDKTGIIHHVDHIIPLAEGGIHHPDNLQILTASENLEKHIKLMHTPKDRIEKSLHVIVEVYGRFLQKLSKTVNKL